MLFLNEASMQALIANANISKSVARAIVRERQSERGAFVFWRELSERVDEIDEELRQILEHDENVGMTSGKGNFFFVSRLA